MNKKPIFSILQKRKWSAYQKFCQRLQKKWRLRKWHTYSQKEQTVWLQRLHRFEHQLQSLGIAATFSLTLLGADLQAQTPVPNGSEFQVNTYTEDYQSIPRVAMDSDGDFVVVWHSEYQDGSEYGIYAQRYNRDGSPNGSEFQVNTYTTGYQNYPSVAMDSDGDFVIAWQSEYQDGSDYGIYAQRYNSDGSPNGDEFQVNTFTEDYQNFPSVGMDSDGDFVISWSSYYQDGSYDGIYAQRYNSDGSPNGGEFQVNTFTNDNQSFPKLAMDNDGDFVISWFSYEQDGDSQGIFAQRYNNDGSRNGDEFQVNSYTTETQIFHSIDMDSDGDFVIAWHSYEQDGDSYGIYAQRYNSDGSPNGNEFQVNNYTTSYQGYPSVGMDSDGDFVIAWLSDGDENNYEVYAQHYNSDGSPNGSNFQVNTYTDGYQVLPSVGMDNDGNFVVAWHSNEQDGDSYGIYAQRYGDFGVGIEDSFLEKNPISFYPNPATSHLYFDFNKETISFNSSIEVQIYNPLGKLVLTSMVERENPELSIEGLTSGMYLVEMRVEGGWIGSEKLMIEK
ncbi:MAG: T9SS type A sorting domain-containing protein [Chitinophagales bacterium]